MAAGFEDELGRAENRLSSEAERLRPRQALLYAAVRESLDDHVHVGRARTGEARYSVHQAFGQHFHRPDGLKNGAGAANVDVLGVASAGNGGGAFVNEGGRIGHRADHGNVLPQRLSERFRRDACENRNDQRVGGEVLADALNHLVHHLRFDGENDNVGALHGLGIICRSDQAWKLLAERIQRLRVAPRYADLLGRDIMAAQEAAKEGAAHVAHAEDGNVLVGKHRGHNREARRYRRFDRRHRVTSHVD